MCSPDVQPFCLPPVKDASPWLLCCSWSQRPEKRASEKMRPLKCGGTTPGTSLGIRTSFSVRLTAGELHSACDARFDLGIHPHRIHLCRSSPALPALPRLPLPLPL